MTHEEIYKKYPHIVPGSIESIARGKKIMCGKNDPIISHGIVCIIKCATDGVIPGCRKTRMINIQDASQVKQCRACIRYLHNMKLRTKRQKMKELST